MKNEYYFVYCKGILGVKTNIHDFKWVYGSVAPSASPEEYEKCIIKFDVCVKPESRLSEIARCDKRFQAFSWSDADKTLSYRRSILSRLSIGYNIGLDGDTVRAEIGKRYLKLVKHRTMNLHSAYYLLSDLANIMLLRRGFLTLYASGVHHSTDQRGILCFAPPNTGKTVTATKLCGQPEYSLVGEDIIITDGNSLFACPWTSSYRRKPSALDSAGALGRVNGAGKHRACESCRVTDLAVLSLGEAAESEDRDELLHRICMLNGYLFNYYSSPVVKVLGYFSPDYRLPWSDMALTMLRDMTAACRCRGIQCASPLDFWHIIDRDASGEKS